MSSCSQHANEKAVGYCVNCDELVCAICRKEIDGKGYCTVCADKLFASTEVKSEQPPPPASDEPWGPPLPSAARPAPLRAIKAKIEAAPVLQAARAVEPESLPAKAASEPAKTRLVPPGVKQPVSNLWWLLPLLFTWIGGVIAGLLTKGRDPKKALHMFLTGLGMTFVHGIVIIALLAGSAPPPPGQPPASSTDQTSSVTSAAGRQPSASAANQQASGTTAAGKTQVGQTAVATNGQVIDVMAQPKTIPYPSSPIPDYKLVPISTQAVQPSDKEQSLNCGDILQVIIPGGELKEQQNLVVSSVDNSPPCSPGETRLAVYDISFEKQHEFNSNLAFKFKYDSALIKGDRPPEMALGVACFDNITQHWLPVASKVDSTAGTITALTRHNGLWMLLKYDEYRNVLITEHCAVIYYPAHFWAPKAARYLELKAQYDIIKAIENWGLKDAFTYVWPIETVKEYRLLDSDPEIMERRSLIEYAGKIPADDRHYYTDNPDVPKYIVDMGYFADHAWNVYRDNFNTEPLQKSITFVSYNYLNKDSVLSGGIIQPPYYSTDVLAFLIYVDPEDIDPQYSTLTGNIDIGDGLALTDDLPETKQNEMKQNKIKQNETKQNGSTKRISANHPHPR